MTTNPTSFKQALCLQLVSYVHCICKRIVPYSYAQDVSCDTYLMAGCNTDMILPQDHLANDDVCSLTDVFFDTQLELTMIPAMICAKQQNDAHKNWSTQDRQQLQCLSKNTSNSHQKCTQNSITKTSKKIQCPLVAPACMMTMTALWMNCVMMAPIAVALLQAAASKDSVSSARLGALSVQGLDLQFHDESLGWVMLCWVQQTGLHVASQKQKPES